MLIGALCTLLLAAAAAKALRPGFLWNPQFVNLLLAGHGIALAMSVFGWLVYGVRYSSEASLYSLAFVAGAVWLLIAVARRRAGMLKAAVLYMGVKTVLTTLLGTLPLLFSLSSLAPDSARTLLVYVIQSLITGAVSTVAYFVLYAGLHRETRHAAPGPVPAPASSPLPAARACPLCGTQAIAGAFCPGCGSPVAAR